MIRRPPAAWSISAMAWGRIVSPVNICSWGRGREDAVQGMPRGVNHFQVKPLKFEVSPPLTSIRRQPICRPTL
jgi:hypothetical protein